MFSEKHAEGRQELHLFIEEEAEVCAYVFVNRLKLVKVYVTLCLCLWRGQCHCQ